ncbi:phosphonate C-P lyase system protein PhnL [Reinekea thalattae]|uniref:Phosphonate C-P lyase system protein PhnL n=1 Tax=Reinekea thalattae TaxID=2593301 RepID=A0A5C8ZBJ8_9GAMM|nr:phosphonate C-P lyase system protein PhnL [Reinekea thalattae]TXR54533.1 phosphonate C-P lyase system protein PhnL [Reinekea thalattae]
MIEVLNVSKTFTLYNQQQARIEVLKDANLNVMPGECVALAGVSGSGKSTLMRMIYGNYLTNEGRIIIDGTDITEANAHQMMSIRRHTLGYVSQFLRVLPRVPTLKVVAEPMIAAGASEQAAHQRAKELLTRLRIPEHLWSLSPLTFSGGEQQRVNIARSFCQPYPALLLDEPTASLDGANRDTVISMINEAKANGAAMIGIFHDIEARDRVADRVVDLSNFTAEH